MIFCCFQHSAKEQLFSEAYRIYSRLLFKSKIWGYFEIPIRELSTLHPYATISWDREYPLDSLLIRRQISRISVPSSSSTSTYLKPCPHCRRKVRPSYKSETVAENGEKTATVALTTVSLFCDSVDRA